MPFPDAPSSPLRAVAVFCGSSFGDSPPSRRRPSWSGARWRSAGSRSCTAAAGSV
ncbi:hypothetical protein [Nocardioides zeae]